MISGLLEVVIGNFLDKWFTIAVTAAITLISGFSLRRKLDGKISSAKDQKVESAKKELIQLIEDRVVNESTLDENTVVNLMEGVEEEQEIDLTNEFSPKSLMQEVLVRIEKSSHLNHESKEKYSENIEATINELEKGKRYVIPTREEINALIDDLEEDVSEKNEKTLDRLKEVLSEDKLYYRTPDDGEESILELALGGLAFVLFIYLIYLAVDFVINFISGII